MEAATHLPEHPALRLQVLVTLRAQLKGVEASVELLECLTAQLPSLPDPSLFADVGSAPTEPDDATQAAAHAAATAAHLHLLAELAARLDAASLGLAALAAAGRSSNADAGPPGSLRIEELDAAAPTTRLPAVLVLAAALYGGGDAQLQHLRPWADGPAAAAAQQLLEALASQLAGVLEQQRKQEVRQPSSQPGALLQEVATTTTKAAAGPHQQSEAVQQLLGLALPPALQQLRPVLAAKVEHAKHKTARLEVYSGPGDYERCVAAGQLAWLLRQLSGRHLSAASPAALALVLLATEDPFPPVQACVLWSLQHSAAAGQAGDLRPHARLVLPAAKRALEGAADAAFPAAAAAATAVVGRLEGANPYAQAYHDVMSTLLGEGELGGHNPERATAWLAAAPALFPRLGLQLAAHFSRLMPLLLGWCQAPQRHVQLAALSALLEAVRLTWPRIPVHAAVLWRVLRRVHGEEMKRSCAGGSGSKAEGASAVTVEAAAVDCGLALWFGGGTAFQSELMTAKDSAQDELLQAVMQRLEECAEQEQQEAAGTAQQEQQEQQAQCPLVQML